jgi:hypothetical protein
MIGTAVVVVPREGALGLALAYAVSYLIHTVIQFFYFWIYMRNSDAGTESSRYLKDPREEQLWG